MITIEFNNEKPIYLQIMDKLIFNIITDVYPIGSKLPSVRVLAVELNVNPNTMQRAFSELEHHGIIITKGTSGRFITENDKIITTFKSQIAANYSFEYYSKMAKIGYNKVDIIKVITELEDHHENIRNK